MTSGIGPIGIKAAPCKQLLQAACEAVSHSAGRASLPDGFDPKELGDSRDRFNVWIGGMGVLRRGRASLDARLSDDDIAIEAVRLLSQLHFFISECKCIQTPSSSLLGLFSG